jgi:hypothetical protein
MSEDIDNVLLETNPEKPYSVTVWGIGKDRIFYIAAAQRSHRWATNLEKDPKVVLSVDGKLYNAKAERMPEGEEFDEIRRAFVKKYDIDPNPDFKSEGAVYKLTQAQ